MANRVFRECDSIEFLRLKHILTIGRQDSGMSPALCLDGFSVAVFHPERMWACVETAEIVHVVQSGEDNEPYEFDIIGEPVAICWKHDQYGKALIRQIQGGT